MFNELTDKAHQDFEARHQVRENALKQTRKLTRHAANAIRAIHRNERENAEENMDAANIIVKNLLNSLKDYPEFYFSTKFPPVIRIGSKESQSFVCVMRMRIWFVWFFRSFKKYSGQP